jgi:hypothetical protein
MYTDYLLLAEIYNAYIETHQSTSQSSKERVAGQRAAPATRSLVLWQRKIDPPAKAG